MKKNLKKYLVSISDLSQKPNKIKQIIIIANDIVV